MKTKVPERGGRKPKLASRQATEIANGGLAGEEEDEEDDGDDDHDAREGYIGKSSNLKQINPRSPRNCPRRKSSASSINSKIYAPRQSTS